MPQPRPEPVLTAAQVSAGAVWLVGLLVAFAARHGLVFTEEVTGPLTDLMQVMIVATAGSVSSLFGGWWARRRVTPTSSPRADDGTPLVRQSPGEPHTEPIPVTGGIDPDAGGPVNIAALRREYGLED